MKKFVSAVAVSVALACPAYARDYAKGADAFDATALQKLRPLAEQGDAQAQFLLGFMYENGDKMDRSMRPTVTNRKAH